MRRRQIGADFPHLADREIRRNLKQGGGRLRTAERGGRQGLLAAGRRSNRAFDEHLQIQGDPRFVGRINRRELPSAPTGTRIIVRQPVAVTPEIV